MVRRMDTQQALGSTGAMNRVMLEQRRRVNVRVAASCVGPLIEAVLCKDVSEVNAQEYQRASLVLAKLCWMDRQVRPEGGPHCTTHKLMLLRCTAGGDRDVSRRAVLQDLESKMDFPRP